MLNCNGRLINTNEKLIMGILNATPDSFYDGEKMMNPNLVFEKAEKMVLEKVDILDIGGMSTRPGAEIITPEVEIQRIAPIITYLKQNHSQVLISIDTIHAVVAEKAINLGADIINDVSGGTYDPAILDVVATHKVPYIIMHSEGIPATKVENSTRDKEMYFKEILTFFLKQIRLCKEKGIVDILLDPGFGFGKSVEENYYILQHLEAFQLLEKPILVGISRKSMINKILGCTPQEALNGTTVLNTLALSKGATILRVHDVKEAVECKKLFEACGVIY